MQISVRLGGRPEDTVGDWDAGVASVGHHELATQRRTRLRVEQDHAAIGAAQASRDVLLEHQQVVQVIGGHEGRRAHINQASLDQLERRMGA